MAEKGKPKKRATKKPSLGIPSIEKIAQLKSKGKSRNLKSSRRSSSRRVPQSSYWQGQMLLASPSIGDARFERSVIYLCHQGEDGALGLVINKTAHKVRFADVLHHLKIPAAPRFAETSVHIGGPVESSRGFVLHSTEKEFSGTIMLGDLAMTASSDILKHIAQGTGPKDYVFLLGYAGWGIGQLDDEIAKNVWIHLPFDRELVFGADDDEKWQHALRKLGIAPSLLSTTSGNA